MQDLPQERIHSLIEELAHERQAKSKLQQQLMVKDLELEYATEERALLEDVLQRVMRKVQWAQSMIGTDKISFLLDDILQQCCVLYPLSDSESSVAGNNRAGTPGGNNPVCDVH